MPHVKSATVFFLLASFNWLACYSRQDDNQKILEAGRQFLYDGRYDSAIVKFKEAKLGFASTGDHNGIIEASYGMGDAMLNKGQCDEAIQIINSGIELSTSELGEAHSLTADGYYTLSKVYGGCANKPEQAISIVKKSLALRLELFGEGSQETGFDFDMLGYYHISNGNYDSALYYLDQAKAIWENKGVEDSIEYSRTLSFTGEALEHKGDLKEALRLAKAAYSVRARHLIEGHPTLSNSLTDIGNIYKGMGNYDQALNHYLPALEMRKKTLGPDHVNVGASYYTIGNLYGNLSNYQRAIHYIEQGNVIVKAKYGEKLPALQAYYAYLGRMYSNVGNWSEAERLFHLSQRLAETHLRENHPYLGTIYGILGDHYSQRGNDALQKEYLDKALAIYRKLYAQGTTSEAAVLVKLGRLALRNDELAKAQNYFETALGYYYDKVGRKNPGVAGVLQHLGDLNRKKGNYERSLELYTQSIEAVSTDSIEQGDTPDFNSLTSKYRALMGIKRIALTYGELYRTSDSVDYLRKSLDQYQVSIELIDLIISGYRLEESKAQLGVDSREVFKQSVETAWLLYTLTGEEEYKHTAFRIVEKSKSPILLSKIEDVEAKRFNGVPDEVLNRELDLRVELSFYKRKLRDAKLKDDQQAISTNQKLVFDTQAEFEELKEDLRRSYQEYYNYKYNNRTIELAELRENMDAETAVLEYFITDSSVYSFLVTSDDFEIIRLDIRPELSDLLDNYHTSLTDGKLIVEAPDKADSLYVSSAFAAYNSLIGPALEKASVPVKNLVVVPDGKLSQVSFGTFLTEKQDYGNFKYKSLPYLLRKYTVSYAYSSTLNFRFSFNSENFAFGGFAPSYKADGYAGMDSIQHPLAFQLVRSGNLPLPGAISEVSVISEFMNGDSWINQNASESNFKENSGKYSVLHLAMHSLLNNEDPEYSELLFNNETDTLNDGYLTINEIYNLELNANMVVLSACSSGSGKIQTGEGPISFTRAFSYAGCPSVIMSMWKIPDAATTEIMVAFYKNIRAGENKDMALQKAQLAYLETTDNPLYQHPFFWGSFVAMGDTRPVPTGSDKMKILALAISAVVLIAFFRVRRRLNASFNQ